MRKVAFAICFLACVLAPTSSVKGAETQLQIVVNGAGSEFSPNKYIIIAPSAREASKTVTLTGRGTVDPPQAKTCSKCDGPNLVATNPTDTSEADRTYYFEKSAGDQDGKTITFEIDSDTSAGDYQFQLTKIQQVFHCPSDYTGDPVTQGNTLASDTITVTVVKIDVGGAQNLYVFANATDRNSSFQLSAAVTPSGLSPTYQWTVDTGSDKVKFNGSTTGANVIVEPKDANHYSQTPKDVTVKVSVSFTGGASGSAKHDLTVHRPYFVAILAPNPAPLIVNPSGYSAIAILNYRVLDQFGSAFPNGLLMGLPAVETFPIPPPIECDNTPGNTILSVSGSFLDRQGGPLGTCLANPYTVNQVIQADAATVFNDIYVDSGPAFNVRVTQTPSAP